MSTPTKILDAIMVMVQSPAIDGVKFYRNKTYAVPSEKETAIVNVKLGREMPPSLMSAPTLVAATADRTTEVLIDILARGDDALDQCERLRLEVTRRLYANESVNGLAFDIEDGGAVRDGDDLDGSVIRVTAAIFIKYRTLGVDND